jgi:hypothetical protein
MIGWTVLLIQQREYIQPYLNSQDYKHNIYNYKTIIAKSSTKVAGLALVLIPPTTHPPIRHSTATNQKIKDSTVKEV